MERQKESSAGNIGTTVIVPAYNEEEAIGMTLEKLGEVLPSGCEVIVVDDGSSDGTAEIATEYACQNRGRIRVVRHSLNYGKGEALKTGVYFAEGENVVWIDADDTYPAEVIPRMIDKLDSGYDAVVCSRVYGRENIPRFNRLGNWLFKVLICGIYGFKPCDPCTGLYGMKRRHLVRMKLVSKRFAIEPEVSMKGARIGLRTLEIPIEYKRRVGGTKLNAVKVGFEDMFMIMRLVFWKP